MKQVRDGKLSYETTDYELAIGEKSSYTVSSDCEAPRLMLLWMSEVNVSPSMIRQSHIRKNLLKAINLTNITSDSRQP